MSVSPVLLEHRSQAAQGHVPAHSESTLQMLQRPPVQPATQTVKSVTEPVQVLVRTASTMLRLVVEDLLAPVSAHQGTTQALVFTTARAAPHNV
jgi:hypothetical protein